MGCDASDALLDGYVHDNAGDNISWKNPDYCELTATYWIWKNDDAPCVGLFHYRRYMVLDAGALKRHLLHWKQNYYLGALTQRLFDRLGFCDENIEALRQYDLVIPKRSELRYKNIENYYELFRMGRQDAALDHAIKILLGKYPGYKDAVEECKASPKGYHYNMFIMRRGLFNEYCEWLFSILDQMYEDMRSGALKVDGGRMVGYVAEFMMGIFFCKKKDEIRWRELPTAFFSFTDGDRHLFRTGMDSLARFVYRAFFPVGSERERILFKCADRFRRH